MFIVKLTDEYFYDLMLKKANISCCKLSHKWNNMIMKPNGPFFVAFYFLGMTQGYKTGLIKSVEAKKKKKKKKKKKSRTTYLDYNDPKNKVALDISVTEIILSDADEMETDLTRRLLIPLSTVSWHNKK